MLISSHRGNPLMGELLRNDVPVIACGIPPGYEGQIGYVAADDRNGGRLMTRTQRSRWARTRVMTRRSSLKLAWK